MAQSIEQMTSTWQVLNLALLNADEQLANQMLDAEKAGKKRTRFMLRIHSRINKLRADRERIGIERLEYAPAPEPKRAVKKAKAVAPEPAPPPVLAKKPSAKKTVGAQ